MSVAAEMARLRRDIDSLAEEIAVNTRAGAKAPLTPGERRSHRAEMQALIQRLDELATKLTG